MSNTPHTRYATANVTLVPMEDDLINPPSLPHPKVTPECLIEILIHQMEASEHCQEASKQQQAKVVHFLMQNFQCQAASTELPANTKPNKPQANTPKNYSGKAKEFENFIVSLTIAFWSMSTTWDDARKINYALSYMCEDSAKAWRDNIMLSIEDVKTQWHLYKAFLMEIKQWFDTQNKVNVTQADLDKL
ncbi:hypothetical protein C0991_011863 [Blastosporella zonata]|nr:hypothetical protein C0991_011863 [Blastosporella zonata]